MIKINGKLINDIEESYFTREWLSNFACIGSIKKHKKNILRENIGWRVVHVWKYIVEVFWHHFGGRNGHAMPLISLLQHCTNRVSGSVHHWIHYWFMIRKVRLSIWKMIMLFHTDSMSAFFFLSFYKNECARLYFFLSFY